jgi:Tfp pilus assembly protein PilX
MNNMYAHWKNNRGSALIVSMAVMLMLGIIGTVAFQTADTEKKLSFFQADLDKSRMVAEAGLQLSHKQLKNDWTWRDGYIAQPFTTGTFTVVLTDKTVNPALADTVVILSHGLVDQAATNIEAYVIHGEESPFKYAVYSKDGIVMLQNSCTDSYNSDSTYAESQLGSGGDVGTAGTLTMKNYATIGGDASTTGGSITMLNSSNVTGDTTTSAPAEEMPPTPEEEYTEASSNNANSTGMSGDVTWGPGPNDLKVGASKTVTLTSGTYYFTNIHMAKNAKLNIAPGAKVKIYLTGDLTLESFARMNDGGKPSNMLIYSSGDGLDIQNNAKFSGGFYGPNATWKFLNNADVYGSIMVKSALIKNSTCVHYDRKMDEDLNAYLARIVACREL